MYINSRLLKVVDYLKENNETSIKQIIEDLDLSERTVRYSIESLNFLFKMYRLPEIEKCSKGALKVDPIIKTSKKIEEIKKLNKHSKEERVSFIKAKILIEGKANLTEIAKILNVSRTAIRGDINQIKEELENEKIIIENNCIVSDEGIIRKSIMKNYSKEISYCNIENREVVEFNLVNDYFEERLINLKAEELSDCVIKIIDGIGNENPNSYDLILIYLLVSYLRMKNGNSIKSNLNEKFIKNSEEYTVVNESILNLEKIFSIRYSENEKIALAEYIQGVVSYKTNTYFLENWIDIAIEVKKLINNVGEYVNIELINDDILVNGLLNHIKPLIYRLRNNVELEHDIYMDVVEPYPNLFEKIKEYVVSIECLINRKISISEIALITLHFLASIDRNKKSNTSRKKVLLVCSGGYGTSELVANQINDLYNIEIIDIISYSTLFKYNFEKVDLIITTLKLNKEFEKEFNIPIIRTSPFLTEKDQKNLSVYLKRNEVNRKKLYKIINIVNESTIIENQEMLIEKLETELFDKKLEQLDRGLSLIDFLDVNKIEIVDRVSNWEEAINICGNMLTKTGDIEKEYVNEIIRVAKDYGVHFIINDKIAIPHGDAAKNINKPAISILYVREAVEFSYERKANLFILLAAKTTKDHIKSIADITKLSQNNKFFNELKKVKEIEEIYELIYKYTN